MEDSERRRVKLATTVTIQTLDRWREIAADLIRRPSTLNHARSEMQRVLDEVGDWQVVASKDGEIEGDE